MIAPRIHVVRATTTSRWRNPRKLMVSADHSPEDDNDGRAQHGVTDDFQALADRLGVLSHGRMVVEGTPSELLAMSPATVVSFDLPAGVEVGELPLPADFDMFGRRVVFETTTPTAVLTPILDEAAIRGVGLDVRKPSLEEVFLALEGE